MHCYLGYLTFSVTSVWGHCWQENLQPKPPGAAADPPRTVWWPAASEKYDPLIFNNVFNGICLKTPLSLRIMDLPIAHFTVQAAMDLPLRE